MIWCQCQLTTTELVPEGWGEIYVTSKRSNLGSGEVYRRFTVRFAKK